VGLAARSCRCQEGGRIGEIIRGRNLFQGRGEMLANSSRTNRGSKRSILRSERWLLIVGGCSPRGPGERLAFGGEKEGNTAEGEGGGEGGRVIILFDDDRGTLANKDRDGGMDGGIDNLYSIGKRIFTPWVLK